MGRLEIIGHFITSFLSYFIPKKKNYWVFASLHTNGQYDGNSKYLFEYIQGYPNEIAKKLECAYVTNNKVTEQKIRSKGFPVKRHKLFWMFAFLRAEIIVIDGIRFGLGLGRFKFIQLWHGTGYKRIVLLNSKNTSNNIKYCLLRNFLKRIELISATSEKEKKLRERAFKNQNVVVTGSPRTDLFIKNKKRESTGKLRILYAPTFREVKKEFKLFPIKEWQELNVIMQRKKAEFLIKKHPSDKNLRIPKEFSHIKDITSTTEDIQELLLKTDVLITDYSSVATDFAMMGKPIVFYTYDLEEYLESSRSFYYNLKEILPGPFAYNSNELFKLLSDLSWFENPEYQRSYQSFKTMFHQFDDSKSSERVLKTLNLLK